MAIAMQYGNGRNGLLNVGMSMTLLWTNVDDESAFAAQTLSLSLGGYDAVLIKFKLSASGTIYANTIGFVGEQTTLYSSNASTTSYTYKRYATVTTSDITFSTGYRGTTAGTSYAIPCEVYGIKRGGSSGGSSSSGSGGGGGGTGTLTQVTFDGTVYTDDGTGNVTFDETDPVFVASDAYSITATDISNWNAKVDSGDLAAVATSGDYDDLLDKPAIHNIPSGGTTGQVLAKSSSTDYDVGWVNQSGGGGSKAILTATILAADWSGSAPYTNAVTVTGLLATDTPVMDLIASSTYATAQNEISDYGNIYKAVCADNTLTVYATSAPTHDLNIQLLCVR